MKRSLTAADIMRTKVITVRPDQSIKELARTLIDNHISGAPVVDREGALVGVVSQTDLVRRERESDQTREIPGYHQGSDAWIGHQGFQIEAPDAARVGDVMTPAVLSADAKTPIEDLARMMAEKGIHRLVITRGGRLAGIVTSTDLIRLIAGKSRSRTKVS